MNKVLVMYSRSYGCPLVSLAKRVLADYGVPYRELLVDQDSDACARLRCWTGFLSVPTLVVANVGEVVPYEAPAPLERGTSPRGINRGAIISEPNADQLIHWLEQHQFIQQEDIVR